MIQQSENGKADRKAEGEGSVREGRQLHQMQVDTGWTFHQKTHHVSPWWMFRPALQEILENEAASNFKLLLHQNPR